MRELVDKYKDHFRPRGEGVELKLCGTFLTCRRFCGVDEEDAISQGPAVTLQGDGLSALHLYSTREGGVLTFFGENLPTDYFFNEEGDPRPVGTEVTLRGTDFRRLYLRDKTTGKLLPETAVVTLRVVKHNP